MSLFEENLLLIDFLFLKSHCGCSWVFKLISLPTLCRLLSVEQEKQERLQRCLQVYYAPRVTTTLIILIFKWILPFLEVAFLLALFARSLFKHIRLIPFHRVGLGKHSHNGILNFSSVFFNRLPFVWQSVACVCTQCHTALVAWFKMEKRISSESGPKKNHLVEQNWNSQ